MIGHEEFDELEAMVDGTMESSDFVGDVLDESPSQDTIRIYVQNINGLSWNRDGGKWPYICEVMASLQVDIACFSEINTDTNRYEVRKRIESICQKYFDKNSLVMATSSLRTVTLYKPGGTAIVACNAITTRICKHTRDRLGRWTSFCFQTSSNKKLGSFRHIKYVTTRIPAPPQRPHNKLPRAFWNERIMHFTIAVRENSLSTSFRISLHNLKQTANLFS